MTESNNFQAVIFFLQNKIMNNVVNTDLDMQGKILFGSCYC